jgi:hypothetical protein
LSKVKDQQTGNVINEQPGVYPGQAFDEVQFLLLDDLIQQHDKSKQRQYDNQHRFNRKRNRIECINTLKEQRIDDGKAGEENSSSPDDLLIYKAF